MKDFNLEIASNYDQEIRLKVPGYDILQQNIETIISKTVPKEARILVIGCGTGEEIIRLEELPLNYNIVGIDPSLPMLEVAKKRVKSKLFYTSLNDFKTEEKFNCILSILVSHFLKTDKEKIQFFSKISNLMTNGGTFLCADYMKLGFDHFHSKNFQDKIGESFFPLTPEKLNQHLLESKLSQPQYFFNSLGFQGFISKKLI